MNTGFEDLLVRFVALGGIAENIYQREGKHGRGIFPVDASLGAKIMTPKNLFIDASNLCIDENMIAIKDKSRYSADEIVFLENYYNGISWGNNGNSASASFLRFIASLPEPIKKQLIHNGFSDAGLLSFREDNDHLLRRFIQERCVGFGGRSVLAPIWELVNHSSFAPPLRITPHGVEIPPIEPSSNEILHKYSGKNSPMGMWKKYGFACNCIVAYSIPFEINVGGHSLTISCSGRLGLGPKDKSSFSLIGDTLSVKSLPVGCLSAGLPLANFTSILSSAGLSVDVAKRLFEKVGDVNMKARHDLLGLLHGAGLGAQVELSKALRYEIELVETSFNA